MNEFVIVTDSACDLPHDYAVEHNLVVLPLRFTLKNIEYLSTLDFKAMSAKDFYDTIREKEYSKTSQVNANDFANAFKEILDQGKDVLAVLLSSALSGTYNSANIAKETLQEDYPDQKIILVDSKSGSLGQGMVVDEAVRLKGLGLSIEEAAQKLEAFVPHVYSIFTHDDLSHLAQGGRIGTFQLWLGTVLKIKPIISADDEGMLVPRNKILGRKKSIQILGSKVIEKFDKSVSEKIFISHADCEDEALKVKERLERELGVEVYMFHMMGQLIGSHGGPGTIAVFFGAKDKQ